MKHKFHECGPVCKHPGTCMWCNGDLKYCDVCHQAEGELMPECPGFNPEQQLNRTLSFIKRFFEGKHLTLKDGSKIGMGEDLTIGYIMTNTLGAEGISPMATLDVKQLNDILNKEGCITDHL